MKLTSPAFEDGRTIPERFTCRGKDIHPRLEISELPDRVRSLCLIMHDPDSAHGDFVHWVAYDIEPTDTIPESSEPGTRGENDFGKTGYGGPCPHSGTHRYVMELFALDTNLGLDRGKSREEVEEAMAGHIVATAYLTGWVAATEQQPQPR